MLLTLGNVATVLGAPDTYANAEGAWLIWLLPPLVLALFASWRLYRDRSPSAWWTAWPAHRRHRAGHHRPHGRAAVLNPSFEAASLLGRAWLFGTAYVVGGRLVHLGPAAGPCRKAVFVPTLIVGAGQVGGLVERRLNSQPQRGLLPVGYLDSDPPPADMVPDRRAPVLGGPEDLGSVVERTGAGHVVLASARPPTGCSCPWFASAKCGGSRCRSCRLFGA